METARLLVVSRDPTVLRALWSIEEPSKWQLESAASGWAAMERVQSGVSLHLLLLDVPLGDTDGLHLLRWLRRLRPELPIILISDRGDEAKQQEAIQLGARDCLVRPLEDQQFQRIIKHHLSAESSASEADITKPDMGQIGEDASLVAASLVMRQLLVQAELLAESDVPVMILGERGSGKETTARLIHTLSARSGFGFAKVNCAALPSDLLEAELFGSEHHGNGVPRPKPGRFELCQKGTLLLQEISEMPLALQAKLVQVLQQKRFVQPGTATLCEVDVRILATSSTPIEPAVSQGKLREDLYYIFSQYMIHVPSLRQRREEVPLLMHHFMHLLAKRDCLSPHSFSPVVLEACQSHSWPGNVGEPENFVKHYLMEANGSEFGTSLSELEDVTTEARSMWLNSMALQGLSGNQSAATVWGDGSLKSMVRNLKSEAEKTAIAATLEKTGWNRKAAARQLKVSYRTLLYKIERYQLKPAEARQEG